MISKGSQTLTVLFEERGKQNQFADNNDVKASLLIRWRRGEQKPDARYRALLEDKLGIPWRSWDEPAVEQEKKSGPSMEEWIDAAGEP